MYNEKERSSEEDVIMELKQLQYFLTVAAHLNFSRAAEALYISQPALSYQIAELERELGVLLFVRDRRKIYLSPAGAALVPLAQNTLEDAAKISRMAEGGLLVGKEEQQLRIGFDDTEEHYDISGETAKIAAYKKANPQVHLEMGAFSFQECVDKLLEGSLDVAFLVLRHQENVPNDLTTKVVCEDRLMLLAPADEAITDYKEALDKYGLIMVDSKSRGRRRMLRALKELQVEPQIIAVDSFPAGFVYLQSGLGCLQFPERYINSHQSLAGMTKLPVPSPAVELKHVAAWHKQRLNPTVWELLRFFQDAE